MMVVTDPHLVAELASAKRSDALARVCEIALEHGVGGSDLWFVLQNTLDGWQRGAAIRAGLDVN